MRVLKQILGYLIWIVISFLSAFGYMLIMLGSKPNPSKGIIAFIGHLIYYTVMIEVIPVIGTIIAVLYILFDVFYLKKKLENNPKRILIRFFIIILITFVIGIIHYILEKVIDII